MDNVTMDNVTLDNVTMDNVMLRGGGAVIQRKISSY